MLSDEIYEIKQHCIKITEKYPIHCGNTVLQLSKLILMKFVMFLYEFLEEDSFELIYSGKILLFPLLLIAKFINL